MHRGLFIAFCLGTVFLGSRVYAQQDEPSPASTQQDQSAPSARAEEESSSKDTRVDLSPPANDAKNHPTSGAAVSDAKSEDEASDVKEFQPWDPHKAAKNIEVGDFYFKRKNYRAALERYKEALVYKPNDAVAQFRLAECLEKTGNPGESAAHYQEYLKILPHGPLAGEAQKASERLKTSAAKQSSVAK